MRTGKDHLVCTNGGEVVCLMRIVMSTSPCACRWDDPYGPVILTSFLILTLTVQFVLKVAAMLKEGNATTESTPAN